MASGPGEDEGTRANAARVYRGLAEFGAPLEAFEVSEADFAEYDGVLQLGLPPRRIDVVTRVSGVSFDEAIADGETFRVQGRDIPIIGRDALIANKKAAGRPQDLADVDALSTQ